MRLPTSHPVTTYEVPHADVKGYEPHACEMDYRLAPKRMVIKSNWKPPVYDAKVRPELEGGK